MTNCGSSSFESTRSVMVTDSLIGIACAETQGDSSELPGNLSCNLGSLGGEQTPFEADWDLLATLFTYDIIGHTLGLPGDKEPTCQCRRPKRCWFNSWVRKISGGGHGNPLRYSCLVNPTDRRAWWALIQRVANSRKRLK